MNTLSSLFFYVLSGLINTLKKKQNETSTSKLQFAPLFKYITAVYLRNTVNVPFFKYNLH